MSITTYAELQQSIADLLHRTDLTAKIPDFIRLAEATINRRLTIYPIEREIPLSMDPNSRFILLPANYGSPIALWSESTSPRQELAMVTPEQLPVNEAETGLPQYWAVDGLNLAFNIPADQAYQLRFRFFENVYLSGTSLTPTFLSSPDLYLYGAAVHSAMYTRDDGDFPLWQSEFNRIMREVATQASRSRGMASLRTEIADVLPNNYPPRRRY